MTSSKVFIRRFAAVIVVGSAFACGGNPPVEGKARTATTTQAVAGGAAGDGETKVTICHIPPGNPDNEHTITVGEPAVQAHLDHGDFLGDCHPACIGGDSGPCTTDADCCAGLTCDTDSLCN